MTVLERFVSNKQRVAALLTSAALIGTAILVPFAAKAQTIGELLKKIQTGILNPLIAFLFTAATLVFLWGVLN